MMAFHKMRKASYAGALKIWGLISPGLETHLATFYQCLKVSHVFSFKHTKKPEGTYPARGLFLLSPVELPNFMKGVHGRTLSIEEKIVCSLTFAESRLKLSASLSTKLSKGRIG